MKFCENCGEKLTEGSAFCESCGTPVLQEESQSLAEEHEPIVEITQPHTREKQETPIDDQQVETPSNEDLNVSRIPSEPELPKKTTKKKGLILLGVVLLLGIAGGGYWWWDQNQTPQAQPVSQTAETNQSQAPSSSTIETSITASSTTAISEENPSRFNTQEIGTLADSTVGSLSGTTGIYVSLADDSIEAYGKNEELPIRAASVIKLFLMEAFYHEADEGTIRLNEPYVLKDYDKVGGTGVLQNYAEGTELTYEELIRHMIVDSDNTAGNIVLNILGGPDNATNLIQNLGYQQTRVERKFVDSDALAAGRDNYTSATDVGTFLQKVYQKQAVSFDYDQRMLALLKDNSNHSKLPNKLPTSVTVYNKTGEYNEYGVQNDAAIFETDNGAYIAVVLSQDGNESQQVAAMQQFSIDLYSVLGGDV